MSENRIFFFILRFRVYLWIGLLFLSLALYINYSWDGPRDWSLHATVTILAFWSGFFGARWAIEDWIWKKIATGDDFVAPKTYPNLGLENYAATVIAVELPDHCVSHWAKSVMLMHKHGKVDLTEKKWSGSGKLFSQPAYRWMKHHLTERGALRKGNWKTAPHEVANVTYLEELRTGQKKIPPPPANWH